MPDYLFIKHLHVGCVGLSALGFAARGAVAAFAHPSRLPRWARVVPHLVDTVLLGSALALAAISAQYPLLQPWLTAKVIGLLAYIQFGRMALSADRTPNDRKRAFGAALFCLAYVIGAAWHRSAWSFAAGLV